jgi:hypothetical protein
MIMMVPPSTRPEQTFATYNSSLTSTGDALAVWNSATGEKVWSDRYKGSYEFVTYAEGGNTLLGMENPQPPFKTPINILVVQFGEDGKPKGEKRIRADEFDYKLLFNPANTEDLGGVRLRDSLGELLKLKYAAAARAWFSELWPNHKGTLVIGTHYQNSSPGPPVSLFSLSPLNNLGPLEGWQGGDVDKAGFSPDDSVIVFLSDKSTANHVEYQASVWSAGDRKQLWALPGRFDDFKFSTEGARLILWSTNPTDTAGVWVYDTRTGRQIAYLDHDKERVTSRAAGSKGMLRIVSIDKDAKRIVTKTNNTLYLWDVDADRLIQKENLFEKDKQRYEADTDLLSELTSLDELIKLAKRRLNKCPGPNE